MEEFFRLSCRCPDCRNSQIIFNGNYIHCQNCEAKFNIFDNKPVLLRQDNEIFPPSAYLNLVNNSDPQKKSWQSQIIPSPSVNLSYEKTLKIFAQNLQIFNFAYVLVIGGGNQKESLDKLMSEYHNIQLVYCDIDIRANVDLFCDAHDLPFVDQVFHGIITTAVLEHVLYPDRAVSEMYRILAEGGILYSEIPFMQQVHEGAYDFTRYTLSGHRHLFNDFSEISSGSVAGAGTALVWAIEHFALCFAWNHLSRLSIKMMIRLLFSWLKYFDYLFENNPQSMDGASCTYFLGKKKSNQKTSDRVIIDRYLGANNLNHL